MRMISIATLAVAGLVASPVFAAPILLDLRAVVLEETRLNGMSAVGEEYFGTLSYDSDFPSTGELIMEFMGRTIDSTVETGFDSGGNLDLIDISVDVPFDFFFVNDRDQSLSFLYEFSEPIFENDDFFEPVGQRTLAEGSGLFSVVDGSIPAVPLPAGAVLLLGGLGCFGAFRSRKRG